jgi:hypothetical protein
MPRPRDRASSQIETCILGSSPRPLCERGAAGLNPVPGDRRPGRLSATVQRENDHDQDGVERRQGCGRGVQYAKGNGRRAGA